MATSPFSAQFEASLKTEQQGGIFNIESGLVVNPRFFCCKAGNTVGVAKDPVGLIVLDSGQRVCTCATVTVDYSGSWSPTSTINAIQIAWGDGNTSNPAWPGTGKASHPGVCGGYALPGTYTITLTVTDLLGATGVDTIQIEVVNCDTFATIEAFCSTNGTGNPIWFTNDAGGNWADRSGEVLAGASAYDLKINSFTVPYSAYDPIDNTDNVELWTCTDYGLYKATDGARQGNSWQEVEIAIDEVYSVLPSKFDPFEIYVLGQNAAANQTTLARSVDRGETWEYLALDPVAGFYQMPTWGWTNLLDMSSDGYYVYVGLLDDSLEPIALRAVYDLSAYDVIYAPGAGTWCGVRADYNNSETVWVYGGLGIATCIAVSEDSGDTWEDVSPWVGDGHSEGPVVCPLLPSVYDPRYVFAAEHFNDESALTTDLGETWDISTLATPFDPQCGERGWWDDYLVFVGNQNAEADHLQLSINLGVSMWTERSGGITATDPVTSIQIMYEHGTL